MMYVFLADVESTQSDVDDRCESDIAGIAHDDLSTQSLGDLAITAGDVRRSYTHQQNTERNQLLTNVAIALVFFGIGIILGNYPGTLQLLLQFIVMKIFKYKFK